MFYFWVKEEINKSLSNCRCFLNFPQTTLLLHDFQYIWSFYHFIKFRLCFSGGFKQHLFRHWRHSGRHGSRHRPKPFYPTTTLDPRRPLTKTARGSDARGVGCWPHFRQDKDDSDSTTAPHTRKPVEFSHTGWTLFMTVNDRDVVKVNL